MRFSDSQPIYLQIANNVRKSILTGALSAGDQLMSTTQYATTYRINPATANKAFALLVDDGLVEKRRGIGMFVKEGAHERLLEAGRTAYADETLAPALAEGIALGLSSPEILHMAKSSLAKLAKEK
jgi:Predicted transcriptional regulators